MRVYRFEDGERRLIGRTDIPEGAGPIHAVPCSVPVSAVVERFIIGTVPRLPSGSGASEVEQAVLAAPGQPVHLLPGWEPLVCWPF